MVESTLYGSIGNNHHQATRGDESMSVASIVAMLSTNFSYGCIMSTLFLLILPLECKRIETESSNYDNMAISKSVILGIFATIAGAAQLISPVVGMLSDSYKPDPMYKVLFKLGRRLPYLLFGTTFVVIGLVGQIWASSPIHFIAWVGKDDNETKIVGGSWLSYTGFFTLHMIGLNLIFSVAIALIPDLVPTHQTGLANGVMSLMGVTGSLFGFWAFHFILGENILSMYQMYVVISLGTAVATYVVVCDRDGGKHEKDYAAETASLTLGDNYNDTNLSKLISPNDLVYALFYEPLLSKSVSDIRNAYWIDTDKHYDFFMVTISRFFYYMGISSQTFFLYFIHDVLVTSKTAYQDPKADLVYIAVVSQAFGALTCIPVGILSDQCFNSRRKPFVYISCLLLAIGFLNITNCSNMTQMTGVCILLGAANGAYLTMDTSLAVDTLEVDEDDTAEPEPEPEPEPESMMKSKYKQTESPQHPEGAAQMLGIWGVFGFLGSSLGSFSGATVLLTAGNSDDGSSSDDGGAMKYYTLHGYMTLFSLSAFYFACSAISLTFVTKKGV